MIRILLFAGFAYFFLRWLMKPSERPNQVEAARALLEVQPGADKEAIQAAYRRLIARVHPDAGGSAELTRQVNEARDILLRTVH